METICFQVENENTPGKKIWNMIIKINGKLSTTNVYLIKPNKEKCTERKEIANLLADEIEYYSSTKNYSPTFQKYKHNLEKQKINYTSDNKETYNNPSSNTELEDSINAMVNKGYRGRQNTLSVLKIHS